MGSILLAQQKISQYLHTCYTILVSLCTSIVVAQRATETDESSPQRKEFCQFQSPTRSRAGAQMDLYSVNAYACNMWTHASGMQTKQNSAFSLGQAKPTSIQVKHNCSVPTGQTADLFYCGHWLTCQRSAIETSLPLLFLGVPIGSFAKILH